MCGGNTVNVEVKIDKEYNEPKIIIYTNEINSEISNIINELSCMDKIHIKAYKDEKLYILKQNDIESIYSENGKVFVRCNDEIYIIKNRLYELESLLDKKIFLRISNSEIINFNKIENIDFKVLGTLILNFKSGNKAYSSRRYIPKIKEFLKI